RLQALAEGYPGAEPANADLLDLLLAFPSAQPPVEELILALGRLEPRLYSIASSPKVHPGELHLTVAAVRYAMRGRLRKGVASSWIFCTRKSLRRFAGTACSPDWTSPSRAIRPKRSTCSTACANGPPSSMRGSGTARISTSAATPPAWRAMSMSRSLISSPSG